MARRPAGIPLDDEPMDFDLGDLPTDEELEAAGSAQPAGDQGGGGEAVVYESGADEPTFFSLFQTWFVMASFMYLVIGFGVGAMFAFQGAAQAGFSALSHPGFYLIVLFWPIAIWQLYFRQF